MTLLKMGRIHPWNDAANWIAIVQGLSEEDVTVESINIRSNWVENISFLLTRSYEPYICSTVKKILRPGDVVIDVGANIGFLSLLFTRLVSPLGCVYAYEPVKRTCDIFRMNVKLNPDIESMGNLVIRNKGLSNISKEVEMYIPTTAWGDSLEIGQSSLIRNVKRDERPEVIEKISVVRLDDEEIQGNVTLIKCDIEGAELLFLEGSKDLINKQKPILIIEWNPGVKTYTSEQMIDLIRSIGDYHFFSIRWYGLSRIIINSDTHCNVLCAIPGIHNDRLSRLWRID